ncbi:MAG: hypothetical protein A3H33_04750 [Betaproteobacteria bacterium RIFCSPLOWO2_02_FULL_65_20]|nr:MAG: hypothetical protein A3H33_04750 [Betaproteobacteria bacterium RIFCSPLOWO2_02_FULL_65_20]
MAVEAAVRDRIEVRREGDRRAHRRREGNFCDFRASADYRRDLIAVLTRRALANAYARALKAREGEKR